MSKLTKRGEMQTKLIDDIHKAINSSRVNIGDGLTFVEIYGCLHVVLRDMEQEADQVVIEPPNGGRDE